MASKALYGTAKKLKYDLQRQDCHAHSLKQWQRSSVKKELETSGCFTEKLDHPQQGEQSLLGDDLGKLNKLKRRY